MDRPIPRTGEIYRHFKNKMYQIVTIATHSETGEKLVIYQALYGDYSCCARPLDMFMSEVDKIKYPDVTVKYRFEKVELAELEPIHIEAKVKDSEETTKAGSEAIEEDTKAGSEAIEEDTKAGSEAVEEDTKAGSEAVEKDTKAGSEDIEEDTKAGNEAIEIVEEVDSEGIEETIEKASLYNKIEEQVNPDLIRFLDADTYAEKRNLLVSMKSRMTDDLIDNIAASLDITVNDGDIEDRFMSLFNCVTTMEKYEVVNRLR